MAPLLVLFFSFVSVLSCAPEVPQIFQERVGLYAPYSDQAVRYFTHLGFGSEFGRNQNLVVKKWTSPLRIQLFGSYTEEDRQEVLRITGELAELTGLSFSLVRQNPNVRVYFTTQDQFSTLVPEYNPLNPQDGLFSVISNETHSYMVEATVLIRSSLTGQHRKHILREELTQSLGLMKDSYEYKDSIFQQNHEYQPVQYSRLDRQVLKILYDKRIRPGMNEKQVVTALRAKTPPQQEDSFSLASLPQGSGS